MNQKKFDQILLEAYERYPENSDLHRAMRDTFISRMFALHEAERKEFNRLVFGVVQLIAVVLIIIAIILL